MAVRARDPAAVRLHEAQPHPRGRARQARHGEARHADLRPVAQLHRPRTHRLHRAEQQVAGDREGGRRGRRQDHARTERPGVHVRTPLRLQRRACLAHHAGESLHAQDAVRPQADTRRDRFAWMDEARIVQILK